MGLIRVIKKINKVLTISQRKTIIRLSVLMVVGAFLEMCSVSLIVPFMALAIDTKDSPYHYYVEIVYSVLKIKNVSDLLMLVALLLAIMFVIKNVFLLFEHSVQYRFIYDGQIEMQKRLLHSYINRPYEFFLQVESGQLIQLINNSIPNTFTLLKTLLELFTEGFVAVFLVLMLYIAAPKISIIMTIFLLIVLLVVDKLIKPALNRAGVDNQISYATISTWLLQTIQGIKDIKVMRCEEYFEGEFASGGEIYSKSARKYDVLSTVPRYTLETVAMSGMMILVMSLIYKGKDLNSLITVLSVMAMAAVRLLPSMNRISMALANISYKETMLDDVISNLFMFDNTSCKVEKRNDLNNGIKINQFTKEIRLENLTYSYPDSVDNILDSVEFSIQSGDSIGIIGESGAGKSTLVDIIMGLLRPSVGGIFVDDVNIIEDVSGWYNNIGYVPQMIFIVDGTIRDNIAFGIDKDSVDDGRVMEAVREAALEEFVNALPNGLDTSIGERGVRISGGQRQRIGIARALYRKPSILVMDEATSALDSDTESVIMESINSLKGKKTMIIIAHRLTTIEQCNKVYKVENKKIVKVR